MPAAKHLHRAPIVEALFDFRVKASAAIKASDLLSVREELSATFPIVEERREQKLTVMFNPEKPSPPRLDDLGVLGVIYRSADGKTLAQFRRDGFTVNRLAPYTSWEDLRPQIQGLWRLYQEAAKPVNVVRLAMRFINRIRLPMGEIELTDYLQAAPVIPGSLPQQLGGFLTRVTIIDDDRRLACNVLQTIEQGTDAGNSVLLDVDAYSSEQLEPESDRVWSRMEAIRDLKNEAFFAYLTPRLITELE